MLSHRTLWIRNAIPWPQQPFAALAQGCRSSRFAQHCSELCRPMVRKSPLCSAPLLAAPLPAAMLLVAMLLAGPLLSSAAEPPAPAVEDREQRVADFLDRLGLTELQVLHLEKAVLQASPAERQQRLARRLADLYAGQLMDEPADEQRTLEIQQRINALVQRIPQADTPALRIMLLQADYNQAESLAVQWLANSADVEAREQALQTLRRIAPELDEHQRALNAATDRLTDLLANAPEGDQREGQEKEYARAQAIAGRATYFSGWANYYLGVLLASQGQDDLQRARDTFRRVLDIRSDDYRSLDATWLGLESLWRCRALIGLGLSESALGDVASSRDCFGLLQHADTPPEMQDQAPYWYLQGLLNTRRFDEAASYASQQVAEFSTPATQGKASFCVALVRAAFGDRGVESTGSRRRLGMLGLEGLMRLGQQQTVEQLLQQYRIDVDEQGGFFLAWLAGRRLLAAAEKSKQQGDYRAAADRLDSALRAEDAQRYVSSAAQCRSELAWALYQLEDYEQAGRIYQSASTGLKATDPQAAAQAAWMAFAAYQKLADSQPRFASLAVDILRTLKRDFPNHPYARRADYYIDKIQRGAESPRETLLRLDKISPGEPSYLAAAYDRCIVLHQLWAASDGSSRGDLAAELFAASDKYLDASRQDGDAARKVKICLLAADAALTEPAGPAAASIEQAAGYLDQAANWIDPLPANDSLVPEYHYRRLQLNAATGDAARQVLHARWLVENAAGTAYELPGLVVAARAADQRAGAAAAEEQAAAREAAADVYRQLVERYDSSPEKLRNSQNARVALSRLAEHSTALGRHDESARRLEELLAAFPTDKNYLRRAALAQLHSGNHQRSLEHWRTLLAGLAEGTEGWYEAKYYQLVCLKRVDAHAAAQVLRQFRLLHPELGSAAWRDKFRALID